MCAGRAGRRGSLAPAPPSSPSRPLRSFPLRRRRRRRRQLQQLPSGCRVGHPLQPGTRALRGRSLWSPKGKAEAKGPPTRAEMLRSPKERKVPCSSLQAALDASICGCCSAGAEVIALPFFPSQPSRTCLACSPSPHPVEIKRDTWPPPWWGVGAASFLAPQAPIVLFPRPNFVIHLAEFPS